ncbi:MAG: 8-oxoguanine deaminase, partial [Pseudomonadota bacterium]
FFTLMSGGARVLGRNDLGQLKVGMRADIALWDISGVDTAGSWDPAAFLLTGPRRVSHLFVEGRQIVRDGQIVSFDLEGALKAQRAGVARLRAGER